MAPRYTPAHLNKGQGGFYEIELTRGSEKQMVKGATAEECWQQAKEITGEAESKPATHSRGNNNDAASSRASNPGTPADSNPEA